MGSSQSTHKITLVDDEHDGVIRLSEALAHRLRGQILEGQCGTVSKSVVETKAPVNHVALIPQKPNSYDSSFPPQYPIQPDENIHNSSNDNNPSSPKIDTSLNLEPHPSVVTPNIEENIKESRDIPSEQPAPVLPSPSPSPPSPPPPKPSPPKKEEILPPTPPPTPPPVFDDPPIIPTGGNVRNIFNPAVPSIEQRGQSWNTCSEEAHLSLLRLREEKDEQINHQEEQWRERLAKRENEYMEQAQLTKENITKSVKNVEGLFMKTSCNPVCQDKQDEVMQCFSDHSKQPLRCTEVVRQFSACVNLSQLKAVLKEETS